MKTRLEAVGTSRALQSVELYSSVAGDVVAVHFEPGQAVVEGQVLVELDSREERLALDLASVQLADAKRLLDRYQRSSSSGAVLPTVLDQAETAVAMAEIELERARIALDDRRSILVSFNVPEAFVGLIGPGFTVDLQTWVSREAAADGEIVDIGSRINPQNRTFAARALVKNRDDRFRPGMSFRVIAEIEGASYPVIAETGVQWGADGAYVWSIRDERAIRKPVDVVQRRQGRVLVDGELEPGELIVVEGIQRMREGIDLAVFDSRLIAGETSSRNAGARRTAGSD